jgi:hypothetical protein
MATADNKKTNSYNIAMWYRDVSITPEELKDLQTQITKECYWYLIGKICEIEKNKRDAGVRVRDIHTQVGQHFEYAASSIEYFASYANAIDRIQRVLPDIALDILEGNAHISLKDTIALSKKELQKKPERRGRPRINISEPPKISVKNTPLYDPDAQINALAYTIPSWVSTIDRTFMSSDIHNVSLFARSKLATELIKLRDTADTMIALIMENR